VTLAASAANLASSSCAAPIRCPPGWLESDRRTPRLNRDLSPHYTATTPADVRSGLCCRWPATLHPCYATAP